MGPLGAALIGGISSIGGALIGGHGQSQANAANAQEAQRNRDFQERMRATQYQTAVADMKAAGLNPALAYQQGGAGTPTGTSAQHQNTAADAANSAASAIRTFQDLRKTAAEIERINAETGVKLQEEKVIGAVTYPMGRMDRDIKFRTLEDTIHRIKDEARSATSSAKEAEASATIRQLAIPEAQAIANFYRSIMGKASPYITSGAAALRGLAGLSARFGRGRALQHH